MGTLFGLNEADFADGFQDGGAGPGELAKGRCARRQAAGGSDQWYVHEGGEAGPVLRRGRFGRVPAQIIAEVLSGIARYARPEVTDRDERNPAECFRHELRGAPITGFVDPSA